MTYLKDYSICKIIQRENERYKREKSEKEINEVSEAHFILQIIN